MGSDPRDIKKDVNRGLAWYGTTATLVSLLDLGANILVLALWISPEVYGTAALAITLFPVLDLVTDMGLSAAVIQRDGITDDKVNTVFWLNLAMSLVLFLALWLVIGPALGAFHGQAVVGLMLTAYGSKLVWQNTYTIPKALLRRELRFKEISIVRTVANLAEFVSKVLFAANGFGVWCFVLGPLVREVGWSIGIQICRPWRPRFVLHVRETLDWAAFGLKTAGSQILFHIYTNLDYQVVGRMFGPEANGYYRLAYDLVLDPCRIIADVVVQVAFPAYARLKHHRKELIDQLVSFTRMNLVLVLGFLGFVFVTADDLIYTLWGEKWVEAATAARILSAVGVLRAVSFLLPPLLEGVGRPALSLTYNGIAAVVVPSCFLGTAYLLGDRYGYLSVAIGWSIGYPIAFAVLTWMTLAVLDFSVFEYLRRTGGVIVTAAAAMAAAAGAQWLASPLSPGLRLIAAAVAMSAVFAVLLVYWQGISPRSIGRAVRGDAEER